MGVLEDHQDRRFARDRLDLVDQRLHRSLPARLRRELEDGVAAVSRQGQHVGEKRGILAGRAGHRQQSVELVELGLRVVLAREPGRPRHVSDDRIERAVCMLRRTEVSHTRMRLARQPAQERRRQARLTYARLARDERHMALARLRLGPAPQQ